MPKLDFTPSISLGNVLTIVAIAAAAVLSHAESKGDIRVLEAAQEEAKTVRFQHEAELKEHDRAIRALEISHSAILSQLTQIRTIVEKKESQ